LILIPALGFGLVFPAVVDLLSRRGRRTGASVGLTYVVNTLGTTLGALGAGFVLVPAVGSQRTLEICVLLIAAALALSWGAARRRTVGVGEEAAAEERAEAGPSDAMRYGVPAVFLVLLLLPRWDWSFAHAQYAKDPR